MPRFVLHVVPLSPAGWSDVALSLTRRFPEIDVVERRLDRDEEVWVCDAPTVTHLRRWIGETRFPVLRVEPNGGRPPEPA